MFVVVLLLVLTVVVLVVLVALFVLGCCVDLFACAVVVVDAFAAFGAFIGLVAVGFLFAGVWVTVSAFACCVFLVVCVVLGMAVWLDGRLVGGLVCFEGFVSFFVYFFCVFLQLCLSLQLFLFTVFLKII